MADPDDDSELVATIVDQSTNREMALAFAAANTFYANKIHIASSAQDVRLTFGKNVPSGIPSYEVGIYMSHTTAKQMSELLIKILKDYELNFGRIRAPKKQKNA